MVSDGPPRWWGQPPRFDRSQDFVVALIHQMPGLRLSCALSVEPSFGVGFAPRKLLSRWAAWGTHACDACANTLLGNWNSEPMLQARHHVCSNWIAGRRDFDGVAHYLAEFLEELGIYRRIRRRFFGTSYRGLRATPLRLPCTNIEHGLITWGRSNPSAAAVLRRNC